MRKLILSMLFVMLMVGMVAGAPTINYPYNNDIVLGNTIPLDINSASSNCYFNYNNIYNQSISCNGISNVDMPNAEGNYTLYVGDDVGETSINIILTLPDPNIIIFFSILIIAIVVLLLSSLLAIVYNLINWSLDGRDMTYAVSIYFGLFMIYFLANTYLGNQFIEEILLLFIQVGALTHIIIPIVGFFMYFFRSNIDKHRSNPNA